MIFAAIIAVGMDRADPVEPAKPSVSRKRRLSRHKRPEKRAVKPSAIPTPISSASEHSLLGRAVCFRSQLLQRRLKHLVDDGAHPLRFQMATVESADHLGWVEMRVLRDFMSTSSETWSYLRPDATTELISTHFFAVWNLLEFVLSTMRSRGFLNNVSNFPDDSYYTVNEEAVAKWVSAGWYGGPNLEAFARNVLDGWRLQLALGSRLEKYQLDEAQLAALVQLLFAHYEADFFCTTSSRSQFRNAVLGDLNRHYRDANRFAEAVDQITTAMSEFVDYFNVYQQTMVLADLLGSTCTTTTFAALHSHRIRSLPSDMQNI